MIRIIRYEDQPVERLLNRASEPTRDVTDTVSAILADVRARGDAAVLDYCEKFDGTRPQSLLVTPEEIPNPNALGIRTLLNGEIMQFLHGHAVVVRSRLLCVCSGRIACGGVACLISTAHHGRHGKQHGQREQNRE